MDYLPSLTYRMLGKETDKKLLQHGRNHYTQTREHVEYMTAVILSNCCGASKMFGRVLRHFTPRRPIPAMSKVQ